jgi:GAF domain-containing protein
LAADPAVRRFGVVAYAGVPLRATDGEPVGTLCAIDYEPRTWSAEDLGLMTDLAAGVIAELQVLAATRVVARHQAALRELTELAHELPGPDAVLRALARYGATELREVTPEESARLSAAADAGEPVAELPLEPGGTLAARFAGEHAFSDDDRAHLAAVGAIAALAG